jgi:MFS transporter, ACS family, D-galactonate transporter
VPLTATRPSHPPTLRTFTPALILLALSVFINYIDRGNLSIAASTIKDELHISASQLGGLLSAFFWTYTAMQFVVGWLVDRFDVNRVLAAGFVLWSLATAATGLVHGIVLLLVMRMILGVGESVAFPCSSKILARHLPEHHRGLANGVVSGSLKFGPAVGTLGAGLLMARYGWRPVFIGIGLISLLWLPAWAKWRPRGPGLARPVAARSGYIAILTSRSFWGAAAGHFSSNYLLYLSVTWLPFYLQRERHLSLQSMTRVASAYFLVDALACLSTGAIADFFIRRGHSPTRVRKSAMALGHATAAIALLGLAFAGPDNYLPWMLAVGAGSGISGAGVFAFAQTLAGPETAGRWVGLQNGFANFAGVLCPALTGRLVDKTGNFTAAFAIAAALMLLGGFAWVFGVGRLEQATPAGNTEPSQQLIYAEPV